MYVVPDILVAAIASVGVLLVSVGYINRRQKMSALHPMTDVDNLRFLPKFASRPDTQSVN